MSSGSPIRPDLKQLSERTALVSAASSGTRMRSIQLHARERRMELRWYSYTRHDCVCRVTTRHDRSRYADDYESVRLCSAGAMVGPGAVARPSFAVHGARGSLPWLETTMRFSGHHPGRWWHLTRSDRGSTTFLFMRSTSVSPCCRPRSRGSRRHEEPSKTLPARLPHFSSSTRRPDAEKPVTGLDSRTRPSLGPHAREEEKTRLDLDSGKSLLL